MPPRRVSVEDSRSGARHLPAETPAFAGAKAAAAFAGAFAALTSAAASAFPAVAFSAAAAFADGAAAPATTIVAYTLLCSGDATAVDFLTVFFVPVHRPEELALLEPAGVLRRARLVAFLAPALRACQGVG